MATAFPPLSISSISGNLNICHLFLALEPVQQYSGEAHTVSELGNIPAYSYSAGQFVKVSGVLYIIKALITNIPDFKPWTLHHITGTVAIWINISSQPSEIEQLRETNNEANTEIARLNGFIVAFTTEIDQLREEAKKSKIERLEDEARALDTAISKARSCFGIYRGYTKSIETSITDSEKDLSEAETRAPLLAQSQETKDFILRNINQELISTLIRVIQIK